MDRVDRLATPLRMRNRLVGCLLVAVTIATAGCGGTATVTTPSDAAQRSVASRFAAALLRGDVAGARTLLVPVDDAALVYLVQQAAAPWKTQHASIETPARRTGNRWTFAYQGRRTHSDGRFETQTGDLVVLVAPSAGGAGIEFFAFHHVRKRFSTHHDAQLLPSNR